MSGFVHNDGGRAAAWLQRPRRRLRHARHCHRVRPSHAEVYAAPRQGHGRSTRFKRTKKRSASARDGITTKRKWFKDYMAGLGFQWVPTMRRSAAAARCIWSPANCRPAASSRR